MHKIFLKSLGLLMLLSLGSNATKLSAQTDSLAQVISSLPNVSDVERLESNLFKDKYVLNFTQPIDHSDPQKGYFKQRVFVMNVGPDRPTVLVTEGYGAQYASNPRYREELSNLLNANTIFVEHRYFLNSTPDPLDWKYLTAENEANDLHCVTETFKQLYHGKWIATGISKGGQNALIYTAFFPKDMNITVPYVAPLCKGIEDGRHEPFLANFVGTQGERDSLKNFQMELLKRRAEIQPLFDSLCQDKKYQFNLPTDQIYDFCVLEFPFAFWQWGIPVSTLPELNSPSDLLFNYWIRVSGPDYFTNNSSTTSFFVQAAKELGYYGYDIEPFKDQLKIKESKGYLNRLFIPEAAKSQFSDSLYHKLAGFLKETDAKMMFIYGEYDPWSAVMVDDPHKENIIILIDPKGSHRSRIGTMPTEMKEKAISTLNKWLSE